MKDKIKKVYTVVKAGLNESIVIHKMLLQGKGGPGDYICSLIEISVGICIGLVIGSLI